ncbi:OLC1v1008566C1 [Oldenlandia corymbosa var. corymbosa]|uniref:OLC1v1008566C1 n=1 Tax=Oldenlandia corymbosa var. corymbosa TaxID=529605 RepID=A0AAV1DLV0_OLDCO|nr:OLC1v1008566C1 [Oldenlandia corymbosa var. corymbosa]
MLETPSERVRLIRTYQRVISEVRNKSTMLEDTVKEAKGINGSPDTFTLCESVKIPSETVVSRDCNKAPVVALPVLEEGRVWVHKPVSRAPPSLTAKTRVNSNQQFLEVKHKDVIPEQHGHGERPTMRQPVALAAEETQTEQQLMHLTSSSGYCRRISSKGQQSDVEGCICEGNRNLEQAAGSMVDQAQENDEELITVADDSNLQSVSWESECNILPPSWEGTEDQKRFDVMNEEFVISATESSAKVLAVKNNLAKMDDQQRSLKGMVKESSPYMTAAELARMVEKIDEINDQIKNMKVDMEQSVEGSSLVSYNKKSEISLMDLFKLLEPVANLACTKTLEEIKAKHFPDLDLKQFPIYDPTVTERVSPVFRGTIESFINEGLALSQVKVDAEESLVLQPLASEHPEVTKKVNLPAQ